MSLGREQLALAAVRMANFVEDRISPPVIILAYHRVAIDSDDPHKLSVSPVNFFNQMDYLKSNFPVLCLGDEWGKIEGPSFVVTFDDGYADNFYHALPVLEKTETPATIFVTTGPLLSGELYWWEELRSVFNDSGAFPATLEWHGRILRTESAALRQIAHQYVHRSIMGLYRKDMALALERLKTWRGEFYPGPARRPLNVDELKSLEASAFVEIGAHTVSHPMLSRLDRACQRDEIYGSRDILEQILGKRPRLFSYPFGTKGDFTASSSAICRGAGFLKATANFPGHVHTWTNPVQLPRYLVRDWDERTFSEMLARFLRF